MLILVWIISAWISCGSGYPTHFWLLFYSDSSFGKPFSNFFSIFFFPIFFSFFVNLWDTFDIEVIVGAATSLKFDCFSIVTRVSEIHFFKIPFLLFLTFQYIYISNLAWNILYREFRVGAATSLTFDCMSILTRAWEKKIPLVFVFTRHLFVFFPHIEKSLVDFWHWILSGNG